MLLQNAPLRPSAIGCGQPVETLWTNAGATTEKHRHTVEVRVGSPCRECDSGEGVHT